jgi:hypothetical protein
LVNLIAIVGLVTALGFAWWQSRKAARAYRALFSSLEEVPAKVLSALRIVIRPAQHGSAIDLGSGGACANFNFLDLNGDGHEELLVQYPSGAHASELKVFA